jgi:cell division protein FtsI/penicillin-binding protein 2
VALPLENVNVNEDVIIDDNENKKSRAVKKFIPPSCNDVIEYFKEKGYTEAAAIKAWNYYEAGEWKDGKGTQVKNWKQKMQGVWFKPENESKTISKDGIDYSKLLGYRADLHGKDGYTFRISPTGKAINYDRG